MKGKGTMGLLVIMMVVASIGAVSAFGGKFSGMDSDGRQKILEAIETKDYNAWKEAMSAQFTEENFNRLVERHEAMSEMRAHREAMVQAIETGDYEAWKEAAQNPPMISEILDEEDFEILVQLHQARQDGDYEKVKELSGQLDLPGGYGKHKRFGHFGRGR